ncbi:PA14 domain-containing protein, partial [Pontibacter harenae]|uniref:PA14 domain-containing protein n=1 Tax=Pontibacter harenae TaxID=2894083 RepID=UPI001E5DC29A
WNSKIAKNGIKLGPNGSAPATPSNQAPTVNLTSPAQQVSITQGNTITVSANASDADGSVTKVEFFLGSTKIGEDVTSPYSTSLSATTLGTFTLTAKATDNKGAVSTSKGVSISVAPATSSATPSATPTATPSTSTAGTGKITRNFWNGVHGSSVAEVPVTTTPSKVSELTLFETPSNVGDNYGQQVVGYVTAPISGQYTFWIAADDMAELWLSSSEDPNGRARIATVSQWTNPREWTKNKSQQSAKITLEAGKRYYIEAIHLEGGGGDNLAVGWQLPNGAYERPIAGNRLSTLDSSAPAATAPTEPVSISTTATGKITHEFWDDIRGSSINDISMDGTPTKVRELSLFEAPSNVGDSYAQRIRGYITAPVSGQYTFWIAADDAAELWLSTSEDPNKKVRIAYAHSWTYARQWDKHRSQQSAKITLEAGKRYYIEAVHKEAYSRDNLAVGWQLPNGTMERPIAGNRLSPVKIENVSALTASGSIEFNPEFETATAYPNPFNDVITLDLGQDNVKLQEIVILNQTGKVVYEQKNNLELENNSLEINLSALNLAKGLYILKYTDDQGNSNSLKIIKQ